MLNKTAKINKWWEKWDKASHLLKRLEQVAARDRQSDIYMVHNEKRLILGLVGEARQAVCYKQQHGHLRFL